jgi:hypothetical protein
MSPTGGTALATNDKSTPWAENIDAAMTEIANPISRNRTLSAALELPAWFPWLIIAVLAFALYRQVPLYNAPHDVADRDYSMGGRTALLMVAEDIERYRLQTGSLPEQLTSVIGDVLSVHYQKLNQDSFELKMFTAAGQLSFNDSNGTVSIQRR